MRILMLSNFYPPAEVGGWDQLSQEVADGFAKRNHQVRVLTSRYLRESVQEEQPHVFREFYMETALEGYKPVDFFLHLERRDRHNFRILRNHVQEFQPDAILIMGMWQLNPQLAVLAEQLCPNCVAYYFCGDWSINPDIHTTYWRTFIDQKPSLRKVGNLALARVQSQRRTQPEFAHVACVSRDVLVTLSKGGMTIPNARVIYNGIDLSQFYFPPKKLAQGQPLRLMFAGAISLEKGVGTALEAMALLKRKYSAKEIHLTLIGKGQASIVARFKEYCRAQNLESFITFYDWIDRSQMPEILQKHDVLLFPSLWEEPLARMMMEGLVSGLVLISTTTGGSKEFLIHDQNSLTFEAGDPAGLAQQVERLLQDPNLMERIALAGQEMAQREFDIERTVDEMANFLSEVVSSKSSAL